MLKTVEQKPDDDQLALSFVQEGFVTFSAVQANLVLRLCQFDGQRRVTKDQVATLADIMTRGKWQPKDKLDFAIFDGKPILLNGYHRMNAQVKSGRSIKWTVVCHPCATYEEVRELYYKFDTNTRIRSGAQILAAVDFADNFGLTKQMAEALFRSVPVIANNFSSMHKDKDRLTAKVMDRRLDFARNYSAAAEKYWASLDGCQPSFKRKFLSAGVCAVGLVTFRYQPIVAQEFWSNVALNDGLRRGDPRQTLHNFFLARSVGNGSQVVTAIAPSLAWNAFFEGRDLQIIKIYERPNIYISGTAFERD